MNHQMVQSDASEQPVALPQIAPRSRGSLAVRAAWCVAVVLIVALAVAATPATYAQYQSVCDVDAECHLYWRLAPQDVFALRELGLSASSFAVYRLATDVVYMLGFWVVGVLIFLRRRDDWVTLLFSLMLVTFGALNMVEGLTEIDPVLGLLGTSVSFFGGALFYVSFFVFPDGRFVPRWGRWPVVVWTAYQASLYFLPDDSLLSTSVWPRLLLLPLVVGLLGTVVFAQVHRYRRHSGPIERQQTKWVVFGLAAAMAVVIATYLPVAIFPVLLQPGIPKVLYILAEAAIVNFALLLIPLSIGVAILRYRLWDIDILINRALVYGALTVSVVGLYVLVVGSLGALLQARGSLLVSLLATGLIAVLFAPLRGRLQRGVNRLMYGERDEPYSVISRLGRRLEGTLVPNAALLTIVETVAQALKLPYAAIALKRNDGELVTVAEYGTLASESVVLPLNYQRESVGRLVLAPRAPGEVFSPSDRRLLEDLSRQAGVAVHTVRLTADLQRSRERLVTAREEERRRLRRDLHDGLGPQLASLTMRAEAAHELVPLDPARAQEVLEGLTERAQDAVADVRRLVYALRPPALDAFGLMGALRSQALHLNGDLQLTIDGPEELPELPAAIEVAAYRIALEALTNVVRHAEARECIVRLALDEETSVLRLEVADDGRGIEEDRGAGVGLTSMRERAEELGGSCTVETAPSGGTRIRAFLPYVSDHVMVSEAGEPNLQEA